jgi:hypothetical protein
MIGKDAAEWQMVPVDAGQSGVFGFAGFDG